MSGRGFARTHGEPARRSAAGAIEEVKRRVATCGPDLAAHQETDTLGEGAEIGIVRGEVAETCPIAALKAAEKPGL